MSKIESLILKYNNEAEAFQLKYSLDKEEKVYELGKNEIRSDLDLLESVCDHLEIKVDKNKIKAVEGNSLVNKIKQGSFIFGKLSVYGPGISEITNEFCFAEGKKSLQEDIKKPVYKTIFFSEDLTESIPEFFNSTKLYFKKLDKIKEKSQNGKELSR